MREIDEIAAGVLKIGLDEIMMNQKRIPELSATYFWDKRKGGVSVIVADDGEKLAAGSSVSLETLMEEFKKGRRN